MADITVTFQNLTSNPAILGVQPAPSGSGWIVSAYPISAWQSGTNASGAVALAASGASGYVANVYPSGYLVTGLFSTDVTVTLATFTVEN